MGIQNLLPFVAKACRQGTIDEFSGCSVAVDVSCLLHRGLFGCMEDIAVGKNSKKYIYYVKKYVDALVTHNCHVILVFDGRPLPAKKETNDGRRAKREENMKQGGILLSQGKKEEASSLFRQSTAITPEIVENTIKFFRQQPLVDIIVAPYESDAQLAFLTQEGLADVVLTEDSDLIPFGCERIAFKWDGTVGGSCQIYDKSKLPSCFAGKMRDEFDFTTFRRICILAGCDYLQAGLKGVGLNKALTFFAKTSQTNLRMILPRVPSYLSMPKLKVTKEFVDDYIRAEQTFLHQVVFDPRSRCQRPLNPYPIGETSDKKEITLQDDDEFVRCGSSQCSDAETDFSFAGSVLPASQSTRLALGNRHSGSQLEDSFHFPSEIPSWSVWSNHYQTRSQRLTEEKRVEKAKKHTGAFLVNTSPEKRRRKKVLVDPEEIVVIDDDAGDQFTSLTRPKNNSAKKEKPAQLRNEAECLTADELIRMYSADGMETDEVSISVSRSTTVSVSAVCQKTPIVRKAATEKPGRKRSRLEALEEAEKENERDEQRLPSPIPSDGSSPSNIVTPSLERRDTVPADDSSSGGANRERTPPLSVAGPRTSTPLTGRSKPLLGGQKSAYFGLSRSSSVSNPFKKPRIVAITSTPTTPSSALSSPSNGVDSPHLNDAVIGTPKSSALSESMSQMLEISSPYSAIFRSSCRAAGLRRTHSNKKN